MRKSMFSTGLKAFALAVVGLVSLSSVATAADLRFNRNGHNSTIRVDTADQTTNLYTAAMNVVIDGSSVKDIVAVGQNVRVSGSAGDDVILAGADVDLRGPVGGSARVAGSSVNIESAIKEDLVVAGGNVYISSASVVEGDLLVAAGSVTIDGTVRGTIRATGGVVIVNGFVGGAVNSKSDGLELGSKADIQGDVNYSGKREIVRDDAAKVAGAVNFTKAERQHSGWKSLVVKGIILHLLALTAVGFVLFFLFRRRFTSAVANVGEGFWKNLGIGFVAAIVTPVVFIILILTVIGYYLAFLLIPAFILLMLVGWIIGALWAGNWVWSKIRKTQKEISYLEIFIAALIITLLNLIPVLGIILDVILVLAGFGSLVRSIARSQEENSPANEEVVI
jgi:hypothetical protein